MLLQNGSAFRLEMLSLFQAETRVLQKCLLATTCM